MRRRAARHRLGVLGPLPFPAGVRGFVLLAACLSLTPENAFPQPVRLAVDQQRSSVAVRLDKGGFLSAFAGHQHGIIATRWSAEICFDPQNISESRIEATVSTPSLRIDTEDARKQVGLDSEGPSADDVKEIQRKMLDPSNLAAEKYPDIRFQGTSIQPGDEKTFVLKGILTIRGVQRPASIPVSFERRDGSAYHFSGRFPVKQTDYGIEPVSIAGVVKVKDEVVIYLDLYATSTSQACN